MASQTWNVRDGARQLTFDGVLLGEVSSHRASSPRWTDMALYRTDSGKYVLTKVGRTVMLHQAGCPSILGKLNLFVDEHPEEDPDDGYEFHDCVPDVYDLDKILIEGTRYWAFVSENAESIVENLHRHDGGVRYLPRMSISLLETAIVNDAALAAAFAVEHIS